MEENIKTIRSACVKANPSILDLVFGCWVDTTFTHQCIPAPFNPEGKPITVKLDKRRVVKFQNELCTDKIGYNLHYWFDDGEYTWQYSENADPYDITILGRDIRLADVLLAINQTKVGGLTDEWFVNTRGHFMKKTALNPVGTKLDEKWNIFQDCLEYQSPECLEFIANLLK